MSGKRFRDFSKSVRDLEESLASLLCEKGISSYNALDSHEKEKIKSELLDQVDCLLSQAKIYSKIANLEERIKSLARLRDALSCATL